MRERRRPDPPVYKAGKMAPDDFLGEITFKPLRAGVPTTHVAVRVQHIDGVVAHARNEQLKTLSVGEGSPRRRVMTGHGRLKRSIIYFFDHSPLCAGVPRKPKATRS